RTGSTPSRALVEGPVPARLREREARDHDRRRAPAAFGGSRLLRALLAFPGPCAHLELTRVASRALHVQNGAMAIEADRLRLARDGGPRARTRPEAPMSPGALEAGHGALAAPERVVRAKEQFTRSCPG